MSLELTDFQKDELDDKARALIANFARCHRQPIWMFCIIVVGGIIGPMGGLIDFFVNLETDHSLFDFLAFVVLIVMLFVSQRILIMNLKHVCFDGNGVSLRPFWGEQRTYNWDTLMNVRPRWFGASLDFSGNITSDHMNGDQFYNDLTMSTQIWFNRYVLD